MEIKKAVFPVAGLGTRFLPATKAVPKELFPVVDKPLVQYAVEEAIEAGIETLIFVTGRNKRAIEDHFDANKELEMALRSSGKNVHADMVVNTLSVGVNCIFVRQPEQLGLGHAVLCAEPLVANEPFAVILADDFLLEPDGAVLANLSKGFKETGKSQLLVMQVDGPDISKYGVIIPKSSSSEISGIVEKPKVDEAPSNLASIGRYVLTPDIFEIIRTLPKGSGGEIQLADAIDIQSRGSGVEAVNFHGQRFDCGSIEGYLAACISEGRARGIIR